MLSNSFLEVNERFRRLRDYLVTNHLENEILRVLKSNSAILSARTEFSNLEQLINQTLEARTTKKEVSHNAVIITMYSNFEAFIESVSIEYLENLREISSSYGQLPEKIQKTHFLKSIDFIKFIENEKYEDLTSKEIIIQNLHHCFTNNTSYNLNSIAYTNHRQNFRFEFIRDFFSDLGIDNINNQVLEETLFLENLKDLDKNENLEAKTGFSFSPNSRDLKEEGKKFLSKVINDLVMRRNVISHGWQHNLDFLSQESMMIYIEIIILYARGLQNILKNNFLSHKIKSLNGQEFSIVKVFSNKKTIGFTIEAPARLKMKIGDEIIIQTRKGKMQYETLLIKSILINSEIVEDEIVDISTFNGNLKIALMLDSRILIGSSEPVEDIEILWSRIRENKSFVYIFS